MLFRLWWAVIAATAKRDASIIVNQAEASALQLEQSTKAQWYSALKERLGWSNAEFLQYVKIKSLSSQPSESMVVGVGALMCAIGSWFAHKFYKGEKLPFELLAPPSAAEEAAMLSGGKANVPITPDVAYTGKG